MIVSVCVCLGREENDIVCGEGATGFIVPFLSLVTQCSKIT